VYDLVLGVVLDIQDSITSTWIKKLKRTLCFFFVLALTNDNTCIQNICIFVVAKIRCQNQMLLSVRSFSNSIPHSVSSASICSVLCTEKNMFWQALKVVTCSVSFDINVGRHLAGFCERGFSAIFWPFWVIYWKSILKYCFGSDYWWIFFLIISISAVQNNCWNCTRDKEWTSTGEMLTYVQQKKITKRWSLGVSSFLNIF